LKKNAPTARKSFDNRIGMSNVDIRKEVIIHGQETQESCKEVSEESGEEGWQEASQESRDEEGQTQEEVSRSRHVSARGGAIQ
jgi:hypothetical protein